MWGHGTQEAATMGTLSERFLQQGLEQGLAQGEHIGMRKGEARVLLTLLRLKFGTVSEAVEARIDQADADTLLRWSGRVLIGWQHRGRCWERWLIGQCAGL